MDNPQKDRAEELMRYLDNGMTDTEKIAFEDEMSSDKSLSEEVEQLQIARNAVKLYGIRREVTQIRADEKNRSASETPVIKMPAYRKILRYGIAVAASVLLVFFAARFFEQPLSADQLYNEGYTRYEISSQRGNEPSAGSTEKAYINTDYIAVINLYRGETAHTAKEMLLAGLACLETGKPAAAIEVLSALKEKNTQENTNAYSDDTDYYLALAYLKNKNYPAAISLMEKINADKHNPYHKRFTAGYIKAVKKL